MPVFFLALVFIAFEVDFMAMSATGEVNGLILASALLNEHLIMTGRTGHQARKGPGALMDLLVQRTDDRIIRTGEIRQVQFAVVGV
jgi:hypothetical protein